MTSLEESENLHFNSIGAVWGKQQSSVIAFLPCQVYSW